MPKRSSKKKLKVEKQPAVEPVTEQPSTSREDSPESKNPAAVLLGRLGGKKGGPARAAKLTKAQRSEIAKKAAQARWQKKS